MFNFYEPMMGSGHFEATYRAFPLAFIDKQSAEYGDKVIMPPSALDRLGERRARMGRGASPRCTRSALHPCSARAPGQAPARLLGVASLADRSRACLQ